MIKSDINAHSFGQNSSNSIKKVLFGWLLLKLFDDGISFLGLAEERILPLLMM